MKKADPQKSVPKSIVYDYPTISSLSDRICLIISSEQEASESITSDVSKRMLNLIERYTADISELAAHKSTGKEKDNYETVVITGTTGNLGTLLLDQLLKRPSVKQIFCLNRKLGESTLTRQLLSFKEKGLDDKIFIDALQDRVRLIDADLSHPRLGLSDVIYEEVRAPQAGTLLLPHRIYRFREPRLLSYTGLGISTSTYAWKASKRCTSQVSGTYWIWHYHQNETHYHISFSFRLYRP